MAASARKLAGTIPAAGASTSTLVFLAFIRGIAASSIRWAAAAAIGAVGPYPTLRSG